MVLEEHESQETTPPTPTSTTPRRHRIRPLDQASLSSSQERSMDVSLSFSGVPLKEGNTWSLTEGGGPPGRTYEEPSSHDTMGSMGASSSVGAFSGTDQAREGVHAALLRATGQQQRPPPGGAVGFVRAEGASSSSSGRVPSSSSSSSIDHRVGAANKGSFGPAALLRKAPRPSSKGRMGASGSAPHDETSSSTSTSVGSASHKSWGKSSSQRYSSAYGGSARFTGVSGRPSGSDQRQSTSENLIDTYRTAPSSRKASAEVPQELPYLATQQPPVSLRLLETASAMAIPPASTAGAVPSAPGSSTPATPATSSAAGRKKPAHQQPLAPAKEVPRPKNPHSRPPGAATSATPTSSAAISLGGADVRTTTTTTAAPVPHHAPSLIPICELKPPPPSPSNLALDDPNIAWLHWRPYYIHDVLGRGGFAVVFRVELCIPHGMSCSFDAFGEPKFNSAGALLLFREDPEQGEGNHTPNNGSSEGSSSSGGFGNSGGSSGELVAFNSARLIEGQLTPGGVGNLPSESDNRLGRMDEINGAGSQSLTLGAARNNDTTDGTAFRSSNGTAGYSQRASTFGGAETRFVGNARQLGLARNNDTLSFVMDGPEAEGAPAAPGREQLSLPAPKVVAGMDGASMEGRLKGTGIFYALKVGQARSDRHREAYEQEIEHLKLFSQERDPLVVRLYDSEIVGEFGSKLFMLLELANEDLHAFLIRNKYDLDAASMSMTWRAMLGAVNAVHDMNIIHFDLKPQNFLICTVVLKLGDFGVARGLEGEEAHHVTQYDQFHGTILYMAPEALHQPGSRDGSKRPGKLVDIWSLVTRDRADQHPTHFLQFF